MILLIEIHCIKKEGNFVTEITGMVAPTSSDGIPTRQTLKAIDQPWDLHWRHPDVGTLPIAQGTAIDSHTGNGIKYFLFADPGSPSHNLLEKLQLCE